MNILCKTIDSASSEVENRVAQKGEDCCPPPSQSLSTKHWHTEKTNSCMPTNIF